MNSNRQIAVMMPALACPACAKTGANWSVPNVVKIRNMPSVKPKSPTRLTRKAFLPACEALFLRNQKLISRYEQRPTPSQARNTQQVVVGQDQDEHAEHEQVQVGEEPVVALVTAHVADRVVVDEHADRAHHDEHHRGQRVDVVAPLHDERTRPEPGEEVEVDDLLTMAEHMRDHVHAQHPRDRDHRERQHVGAPAHEALAEQQRDHEPGQRQERDQRDGRLRAPRPPSLSSR